MKCIILAAGYATRLYPLTENFPKPLLPVGGKPILDWLISDIDSSDEVDEYIVVSNHKFIEHFNSWAQKSKYNISVIDDGTVSNETRLGAVNDIVLAVDKCGIDADCLVIAGDNVLDFSLCKFIDYAKEKNASCVMRYFESDVNKLKKCGVITLSGSDRITAMAEKPAEPESNWCCPPFYFYKKDDVMKIKDGIKDGCGVDAPGSYAAWLCKRTDVYAMEMPGKRFDVGNIEGYEKINKEYKGIKQ
ncbi:MAG: nucleotidyltransferase family protein [Oscillospiraceae bacterium]|nr:nucleotidyltransferase family protein [Oscillospiraceae bacterium]